MLSQAEIWENQENEIKITLVDRHKNLVTRAPRIPTPAPHPACPPPKHHWPPAVGTASWCAAWSYFCSGGRTSLQSVSEGLGTDASTCRDINVLSDLRGLWLVPLIRRTRAGDLQMASRCHDFLFGGVGAASSSGQGCQGPSKNFSSPVFHFKSHSSVEQLSGEHKRPLEPGQRRRADVSILSSASSLVTWGY